MEAEKFVLVNLGGRCHVRRMITDVPTVDEFMTAGLNQLYLAWQIAMQAIGDYEMVSEVVDVEEGDEAGQDYWAKSQPALANAFGLTQQAMEMALKGRIAAVSPYLLISRDPKEWPKGVDTGAVPFSEFRTLDAVDLVKVHNTFAHMRLPEAFVNFWNDVRRDRNRIMHSVPARPIEGMTLVRTVLTAAETLFSDTPWPLLLLRMESEGKYAAYGLDDGTQNVVMKQVDMTVRNLMPAESRRFFGFDPGRREYSCPTCLDQANSDWDQELPKLAQFAGRRVGDTVLHCALCKQATTVERTRCADGDCKGDVVHDNICLSCLSEQDDPSLFSYVLIGDKSGDELRYRFVYARGVWGGGGARTSDERNFPNDEAAREFARQAMSNPKLLDWETVTVRFEGPRAIRLPFGVRTASTSRLLGSWLRDAGGLIWKDQVSADAASSSSL